MGAKKENAKEKKKISLTSKIFIALIVGAVTGMVLHYLVPDGNIKNDVIVEGVLYVLGQGFIRLMKMLVVPLVFCSLVCGSMAIGDTKKLGNVGGKTSCILSGYYCGGRCSCPWNRNPFKTWYRS